MNLVERFFADPAEDCVRAGGFRSVAQLVEANTAYLAERNARPKPCGCWADGQEILARIHRDREALAQQRAQHTAHW